MVDIFHDARELPPNARDLLGVPSWRWVVMWAVLVGIILAGMFGILHKPMQDYYLVSVAAVAVGVALAVYVLSWTHALLPHEH
jgi:undecaprenyl pyrophosphate phosphatase UppP